MGLLDLAVIDGHIASTLHDSKMQRYRKHHSPYSTIFGFLSFLLHSALVLMVIDRIYKWKDLVMISFTAGIFQTIFYGDFIYYFIQSNQNERIINLPI